MAEYLNDLAELDSDRGIAVWLVEAKAVRIGDSAWAPLFSTVVEPNAFTATVEQAKQASGPLRSIDEFWATFDDTSVLEGTRHVVAEWAKAGHKQRLGPNHIVLEAKGPSISGYRTVVALYADGRLLVPFGSYAGQNSGIPIDTLTTTAFRSGADALFGFSGSERQARTSPGWVTSSTAPQLLQFCLQVAAAYAGALNVDE